MTPPRPPGALFAALVIGAAGLLILGAQPLLYGAYVHDGTISEARLGLLAATEIAAIAAGSAAGIAVSRAAGFRMTALLGILLLLAGNLAPMLSLFGARAVAGLGGGLLVALAARLISERPHVNTPAGAFLFLQALTQFAILQWFSARGAVVSAPDVQLALAVLVAAVAPLVILLPRREAAIGPTEASQDTPVERIPPLSGWLALIAAGLFIGAAVGIWAYLGLWLEHRGASPQAAGSILTASMVGQIFGALAAAWIGERGHNGMRVFAMSILMLGCVALLYSLADVASEGRYLVIGYGFVWMVATPALSGFILDADATRRSLPFAPAAQLGGAALLPTVAGELFAARSLDLVIMGCAAALLLSLVFVAIALATAHREAARRIA